MQITPTFHFHMMSQLCVFLDEHGWIILQHEYNHQLFGSFQMIVQRGQKIYNLHYEAAANRLDIMQTPLGVGKLKLLQQIKLENREAVYGEIKDFLTD